MFWEPLQNACGTPAPARAMPCNDVSSAPPAPAGAALPCPNRICHVRIALPCPNRFAMFGSHCHVRMCGERNAMAPQHKGAPRRTERHSANKTGLHDNRSGVTPQTKRCGTTNETAWRGKQNGDRYPDTRAVRLSIPIRPSGAGGGPLHPCDSSVPADTLSGNSQDSEPRWRPASGTPSADQAAAAPSVDFTCSTMALNAGLSLTASSASTLRSRPMLAFSRPFMKTL